MSLKLRNFLLRVQRRLNRFSAPQIIVLVFLLIILAGSILLTLPVSSKSGQPTPFLTALFTATSCTCVTGLALVDTFTHWSGFGQAVMLLMIQVGGLGFMTIAALFFFAVHRKISLKQRLVMAQSLGLEGPSGVVRMVRLVLRRTMILEGAGAVLLTVRFCFQMPFAKALWWGVFHAISAFCNAGFDVMGAVEEGGSLVNYVSDPAVNLILMALIILGGLGFFVWDDILKHRRFRELAVHTRLVLVISAVLTLGGAVIFALLEWNNPATLGDMTVGEKVLAALFQSVTTRTAGFYTVPQGALTGASKAVTDVLMFIGGSSGSTAGGVKTVTMGVLLLSVLATARGRSRVTVFHRTIPARQISDAAAVVGMVLMTALVSGVILSASNGLDFMDCFYETVSAIATVGLSTGITAELNILSRLIVIVLMFFGRVGMMTISLGFLLSDQAEERYRYAETKVLIG